MRIAGMAYGTETLPRWTRLSVRNIYVATAKRMVSGRVGMIWKPAQRSSWWRTGKATLPDRRDMLGQAEHDKLASAVLLTDSRALAEAVSVE